MDPPRSGPREGIPTLEQMANLSQRASHWSLTINNPTSVEFEQIELARQKGWKITGQQETGKEGTPHLQLHLATPQVRFSAVKKTFPRAHIQVARNVQALEQYVTKEETRTGELPTAQDKYPSLSKFWILVFDKICSHNWINWSDDKISHWWKDAFYSLGYPNLEASERPPTVAMRREFAMMVFDDVIQDLISEGYHVDQFYSPPNMNLWKKFHFSILQRCYLEKDAQTSRQTDTRLIHEDSVAPQEYNHASQDVSQEAHQSPPSSPRT